jgi:hypothetical protein
VSPRVGLGEVQERKFLTQLGFELRPLGLPARNQSLYGIHICVCVCVRACPIFVYLRYVEFTEGKQDLPSGSECSASANLPATILHKWFPSSLTVPFQYLHLHAMLQPGQHSVTVLKTLTLSGTIQNRVASEIQDIAQLIKILLTFYATPTISILLTHAQASCIPSTPSHPVSVKFTLISSCHRRNIRLPNPCYMPRPSSYLAD